MRLIYHGIHLHLLQGSIHIIIYTARTTLPHSPILYVGFVFSLCSSEVSVLHRNPNAFVLRCVISCFARCRVINSYIAFSKIFNFFVKSNETRKCTYNMNYFYDLETHVLKTIRRHQNIIM